MLLVALVLCGSDSKEPACNAGVEKAMATHSSTLAWKIPWTGEPGRLQSMGVAKSRTQLSDFMILVLYHRLYPQHHLLLAAFRAPHRLFGTQLERL